MSPWRTSKRSLIVLVVYWFWANSHFFSLWCSQAFWKTPRKKIRTGRTHVSRQHMKLKNADSTVQTASVLGHPTQHLQGSWSQWRHMTTPYQNPQTSIDPSLMYREWNSKGLAVDIKLGTVCTLSGLCNGLNARLLGSLKRDNGHISAG